jgi:hypothetical protein
MEKVTPRGARNLTRLMDRVAATIEKHAAELDLDPRIVKDYVFSTDFVGDLIERKAGVSRKMKANFDAEEIAEGTPGPLEQDPDESYMQGQFDQGGFRELREEQESGSLGVQASFKGLIAALKKIDPTKPQSRKVARALNLARKVAEAADEDEEEAKKASRRRRARRSRRRARRSRRALDEMILEEDILGMDEVELDA